MSKIFNIPNFIIDLMQLSKTKNGRMHNHSFEKNSTEKTREWFKTCPFSPRLIFKFVMSNNLTCEMPKCPVCGKELTEFQIIHDIKCCSKKCSSSFEEAINKGKQTKLKKYGDENYTNPEKRKKTLKERYGDENYTNLEKAKQTSLKRYGVEYYINLEKAKQTRLEKYGNENYNNINQILKTKFEKYGDAHYTNPEKRKKTLKERYGDENYSNSEKAKQTKLERYGSSSFCNIEKRKETNLKKYGVEHATQRNDVKEKIFKINLEKYGVGYYSKTKEYKEKVSKTRRLNFYDSTKEFLKLKGIDLLTSKEELKENNLITLKHSCGHIWTQEFENSQKIHCPICLQKCFCGTSEKENDLFLFIKSLLPNENILRNTRAILDGKELDIYIPEKKLAIEFNGNFWHNSENRDKNYHQEKTLKCREKGIRLIHIFEYEWDLKQEKIKNLIKSALGLFDETVYARKCVVKEINSKEYKTFLEFNHLQGYVNSPIRFGLFNGEELISVIGFGKSRFKKGEMELHRYCVKQGYKVIGGFSKLIKHSGIEHFVSYIDLAHFSGDGYKKLGFKELNVTNPNYVYYKKGIILSRIECQKHKLQNLLKENFNASLSETENMKLNNYFKIYDSGNLKVVL